MTEAELKERSQLYAYSDSLLEVCDIMERAGNMLRSASRTLQNNCRSKVADNERMQRRIAELKQKVISYSVLAQDVRDSVTV